jgi:hypothetical protein
VIGVPNVGAVCGSGKRTVRLREISPGAEWEKDQSSWKRRKISGVDLGGCYERALFDVAGPAPRAGHS